MAIGRTEVQKRQVPFGNGNRGFLNLAGPHRADSAPGGSKGKDPDPVKQTSQLNVRHFCHVLLLPGRPLKSLPQCQAFQQLQYRFSHLHPLFPRRQSAYGNGGAYPGPCQSRLCVPRVRCRLKTAEGRSADRWEKIPPHKQGGSSPPPVPCRFPAVRSMRQSDMLRDNWRRGITFYMFLSPEEITLCLPEMMESMQMTELPFPEAVLRFQKATKE